MSDRTDDELLQDLRRAASRIDPIPPEAVAGARSAIMWRTVDAELAELTEDLAGHDPRLVGVRAANMPVLLSFAAGDRRLELEVIGHGGGRLIFGQLVPAGPGRVVILHRHGETTVEADEGGRFSAGEVSPGAVRVRWQGSLLEDAPSMKTDWFLI